MSTVIRNEISENSKYYISKDRYLELLHFCRQYPDWKIQSKALRDTLIGSTGIIANDGVQTSEVTDKTLEQAAKLEEIDSKMQMVDKTLIEAGDDISTYLQLAVTVGKPFKYLQTVMDIPCSKNYFYERYRRFFYMLDKVRR